jgi:DUF2934 family protein
MQDLFLVIMPNSVIASRMESTEHQRVEILAYYIYLAEGWAEGQALRHWLEAEYQIQTDALGDELAAP